MEKNRSQLRNVITRQVLETSEYDAVQYEN